MRLARLVLVAGVLSILSHSASASHAPERIALKTLAERHGMAFREDGDRAATMAGSGYSISCFLDKSHYLVNGVCVYGHGATERSKRGLTVTVDDWKYVLEPLVSGRKSLEVRCICVDAGHGGRDAGANQLALNLSEKFLNLDVAQRLCKLLQNKGFKVLMTRDGDRFVPLEKRSSIANCGKADLLVSIHFNASENSSAQGIETYIIPRQGTTATARLSSPLRTQDGVFYPNNKFDDHNLLLAHSIEGRLIQLKGVRDRGVRRGRFCVLEGAHCPAVLVECGFITNPTEGALIARADYRQAIASAICDGITNYASGIKH
ncbi:MAG: N-acetylmuramoyl-L-alanine amidase [Puniceicoccales bacterium]|jgi:N-acetylmuramoyl-L-alanine amidase|nr:N-acetylmuramoyl-L-alanine amidase [Puniceicoccales bacterium]